MSTRLTAALAAVVMMGVAAGTAEAQTAPTCSFDPGTATVTVTVNGLPAEVSTGSTGKIRRNGALCGAATVTTTDFIQINGSFRSESFIVSGTFAPGLTAEVDGASEIEIALAPGTGVDTLTMTFGDGADRVEFTAGGVDLGNDGDQDITFGGAHVATVDGGDGNDTIDARAYEGGTVGLHGGDDDDRLHGSPGHDELFGDAGDDLLFGVGGNDRLHGGDGNDRITGTNARDLIYGDAGDDTLYGRAGNDEIYPGPGNDVAYGGSGLDRFFAEPSLDGSDVFDGGGGVDRVSYAGRTSPVILTIDTAAADDGEAGEGDFIMTNVEDLIGGDGDDVLVGSSGDNELIGNAGDDELHGRAGDDFLAGVRGNDILFGDEGNDTLNGQTGADVLTGGPGMDLLMGWDGNDTIFNADGEPDDVQCGNDTDDAEPDPLDTFSGCEL